ncbi:hypothetical protein [Pseudovibrio exalbescens]|uniref:hypothetical protein n=1 Tax=Pseudovibrio exalbescens TaxID=197461 RepID=UPI000C9CCD10|nr:hypothetical protein [Pseudovibrio exalbescens]
MGVSGAIAIRAGWLPREEDNRQVEGLTARSKEGATQVNHFLRHRISRLEPICVSSVKLLICGAEQRDLVY